jgi:C4-dicarboxylate transporter DctQ subunit
LARAGRIFDRILNIAAILAASMLAFTMLAVGVEVFSRFFFGESLTWVIDIASMLLLYITLLSAGWLLREKGHIRIDALAIRLSPKKQRYLRIFTSIITTLIFAIIVWYGAKSTWYFYELGYWMPYSLETPKYLIIIVIPVGAFLLFIQSLRDIYKLLRNDNLPSKSASGIKE